MSTRYKIFQTTIFFIFYSLIYFLTAKVYHLNEAFDTRIEDIDYSIPLVSWTVWIYVSFYPLIIFGPLFIRDDRFKNCLTALFSIGFFLSVFYILFPTTVGHRFLSCDGNISDCLLATIYILDVDLNALPSSHVAITTLLCWRILFDSHPNKKINTLVFLLSLGIVISTILVRQHSVADLGTGVITGCLFGYLTNVK